MSRILQSKIDAVRRKQALLAAARGLAAMAGLAVLLLAAGMLLDWFIELSRPLRAGLLAADLALLTVVFLYWVPRPIFFGPDDDEIALVVEREMPEFRTRLIASVQLSRPGAVPASTSRGLVDAMLRQTEGLAEAKDFAAVVRADQLTRTAIVAALLVLFATATYIYGGDVTPDLLKRAFLANIPVPRNTRVECLTGDRTIAIGDDIVLEALARGVIPVSGTLEIDYDSGREQRFTMDADERRPERFFRAVENVQESFTYRIRLNDGRSQSFGVEALPRPAVVGLELHQQYPTYTWRPAERRSPGDLSLLAGSRLTVNVAASKPVKEGGIRLVGLETDVPLSIGPQATQLTGSFEVPARGLTGFSIRLVDHSGIASKAETVYPIDVLADREPLVRVIQPDRKEELATQQARLRVSFEASDDFGIARIFLRYRVDEGDDQFRELDLAAARGAVGSAQAGGFTDPDRMEPDGHWRDAIVAITDRKAAGELRRIIAFADGAFTVDGAWQTVPESGSSYALLYPEDLRRIRRTYEFNLGSIRPLPLEGSAVEYWLEVRDANDVTGPGVAESERYRAKIVSEIEKRAEVMSRLNDQLGAIDHVTTDQEKLNQTLGALILERPGTEGRDP